MAQVKPLAIRSWARLALEENRRMEADVKETKRLLEDLRKSGADSKKVSDMEAVVRAMEKRVKDAKR